MPLRDIDKKVIDAFFERKHLDGKMLITDGSELEKLGLGGHVLAKWVDHSGSSFSSSGFKESKAR